MWKKAADSSNPSGTLGGHPGRTEKIPSVAFVVLRSKQQQELGKGAILCAHRQEDRSNYEERAGRVPGGRGRVLSKQRSAWRHRLCDVQRQPVHLHGCWPLPKRQGRADLGITGHLRHVSNLHRVWAATYVMIVRGRNLDGFAWDRFGHLTKVAIHTSFQVAFGLFFINTESLCVV